MKKFLITCAVFGLSFLIFDKVFLIVRNLSPQFDFDRRLEAVLEGQMNYDLIVLGSSRANSHIATWMLEEQLNLNSYNLAYGGSAPEFQLFVLKVLLENNTPPKIIIKPVDDDFELYKKDEFGNNKGYRVDRLYPLVKYDVVRKELERKGERNKLFSKLFVLHQLNKSNFDFRKPISLNDTILEYGAKPLAGYNKSINWEFKSSLKYEKEKEELLQIESLNGIENLCTKNNIILIYASAPGFKEQSQDFLERIREVKGSSIPFFIPDRKEVRFREVGYFGDLSHLNKSGAEIYTQELIDFISKFSPLNDL